VICGSLEINDNVGGYINFEDGSTGTLTVQVAVKYAGTNTTFQALWDLGRLRFQDENTGDFASLFQVVGQTLSLR